MSHVAQAYPLAVNSAQRSEQLCSLQEDHMQHVSAALQAAVEHKLDAGMERLMLTISSALRKHCEQAERPRAVQQQELGPPAALLYATDVQPAAEDAPVDDGASALADTKSRVPHAPNASAVQVSAAAQVGWTQQRAIVGPPAAGDHQQCPVALSATGPVIEETMSPLQLAAGPFVSYPELPADAETSVCQCEVLEHPQALEQEAAQLLPLVGPSDPALPSAARTQTRNMLAEHVLSSAGPTPLAASACKAHGSAPRSSASLHSQPSAPGAAHSALGSVSSSKRHDQQSAAQEVASGPATSAKQSSMPEGSEVTGDASRTATPTAAQLADVAALAQMVAERRAIVAAKEAAVRQKALKAELQALQAREAELDAQAMAAASPPSPQAETDTSAAGSTSPGTGSTAAEGVGSGAQSGMYACAPYAATTAGPCPALACKRQAGEDMGACSQSRASRSPADEGSMHSSPKPIHFHGDSRSQSGQGTDDTCFESNAHAEDAQVQAADALTPDVSSSASTAHASTDADIQDRFVIVVREQSACSVSTITGTVESSHGAEDAVGQQAATSGDEDGAQPALGMSDPPRVCSGEANSSTSTSIAPSSSNTSVSVAWADAHCPCPGSDATSVAMVLDALSTPHGSTAASASGTATQSSAPSASSADDYACSTSSVGYVVPSPPNTEQRHACEPSAGDLEAVGSTAAASSDAVCDLGSAPARAVPECSIAAMSPWAAAFSAGMAADKHAQDKSEDCIAAVAASSHAADAASQVSDGISMVHSSSCSRSSEPDAAQPASAGGSMNFTGLQHGSGHSAVAGSALAVYSDEPAVSQAAEQKAEAVLRGSSLSVHGSGVKQPVP